MSIFSSLFAKEPEIELASVPEPAAEPGRQPESAPTGELFEGMRVNVMTKEGDPLLSGKITGLTSDTLTLGRLPGELSFKTATIGTICLSATVQESGRTVFKVKNLKVESHSESRDTFRLPFNAPVSLYRKDDEHLRNPEHCTLVNISTGGCCVQSEYIHMEDEVLRIRVKLEDYAPLNFLGQIVRCMEHAPGQFWYGILFAQLTEQEITALNKTLYNLQMGIKETRVRGEDGHW